MHDLNLIRPLFVEPIALDVFSRHFRDVFGAVDADDGARAASRRKHAQNSSPTPDVEHLFPFNQRRIHLQRISIRIRARFIANHVAVNVKVRVGIKISVVDFARQSFLGRLRDASSRRAGATARRSRRARR